MSPELEDALRKIVQLLGAEKSHYPNGNTRDAIQAVRIAISQTIMKLRQPKES